MKEHKYKINGIEYTVVINSLEETEAQVEVNGTPYTVEILTERKKASKPIIKRPVAAATAPRQEATAPVAASSKGATGGGVIKAPLPGVIIDVVVAVGDEVKKGQKLAILEAMKMENSINSDRDGKVLEIKVQKGDSILEGTDIIIIG